MNIGEKKSLFSKLKINTNPAKNTDNLSIFHDSLKKNISPQTAITPETLNKLFIKFNESHKKPTKHAKPTLEKIIQSKNYHNFLHEIKKYLDQNPNSPAYNSLDNAVTNWYKEQLQISFETEGIYIRLINTNKPGATAEGQFYENANLPIKASTCLKEGIRTLPYSHGEYQFVSGLLYANPSTFFHSKTNMNSDFFIDELHNQRNKLLNQTTEKNQNSITELLDKFQKETSTKILTQEEFTNKQKEYAEKNQKDSNKKHFTTKQYFYEWFKKLRTLLPNIIKKDQATIKVCSNLIQNIKPMKNELNSYFSSNKPKKFSPEIQQLFQPFGLKLPNDFNKAKSLYNHMKKATKKILNQYYLKNYPSVAMKKYDTIFRHQIKNLKL